MNDLERQELELLAGARRAISPAPSDAERVLEKTMRALHAAPAGADGPVHEAASGAMRVTGWLQGARAPLIRTAIALSIAAASGAIGYELGRRSARSEQTPAPRTPPEQVLPGLEPPLAEVEREARATESAARSAETVPPPASSDSDVRAERNHPARNARSEHDPTSAADAEPRAVPSPDHSLELEIRALERVERALRERDPRRALELLGELDRAVPGGKLQEERLAAFMMARCALGAGTPEALVREFARSHPQSVYFARVRQACLGRAADAAAASEDP